MGKLNPGDPILADYLNRHEDAANAVLGHALGGPGGSLRLSYDTNRVTAKNGSGADRRRGEILEFTGSPLSDFTSGELWLTGGSPTLANGFGVLLNPLPNNAIGNRDCQVAGSCLALVNVTDSNHKFASPANANFVLQSAGSGAVRILHKPSGTGEKQCAVLLGASAAGDELVQLNHATATAGDIVAANASGVHPGRIRTWNGSGYTTGATVWLLLTDYYDLDGGNVIGEHAKYYGPARAAGNFTHSSDTRPLYVARVGDQTFLAQTTTPVNKGDAGTFKLYHRSSETDSGLTKTAQALGVRIAANKWATVQRINREWYAGCWE